MYHIYHTEGIILASVGTGEADRFLRVLTPDFGLIGVVARGSRLIGSKMKYHLSEYRHVAIDIVRGKNVWTLVGIRPQERSSCLLQNNAPHAEFSVFLRRFIRGEEGNALLFAVVAMCVHLMSQTENSEKRRYVLAAGKLAALSTLGYADERIAREYVTGILPKEQLSNLEEEIRVAVAESHL